MRLALIIAMFFVSTQLFAATVECTTRIGFNGYYDLVLDTDASTIQVTTTNGSVYKGIAGHTHSVSQARDFYFLPLGYNMGIEVRVDSRSPNEVWMCLDPKTCGLCRM